MATSNQQSMVEGNREYITTEFPKGHHLGAAPVKKCILLTCMDSRIDTFAAFNLQLGDAHIIRNAGGNASDAIRSIVISQHLLGTREVILVKHTGCGLLSYTDEQAAKVVEQNGCSLPSGFEFQAFADLEKSVKEDVEVLKGHGGLVKDSIVTGWVFEVETGKVRQVV